MIAILVRATVDFLVCRQVLADHFGRATEVVFQYFKVLVGRYSARKHPPGDVLHPVAEFHSLAVAIARGARWDFVRNRVALVPNVGRVAWCVASSVAAVACCVQRYGSDGQSHTKFGKVPHREGADKNKGLVRIMSSSTCKFRRRQSRHPSPLSSNASHWNARSGV